MLAQLNDQLTQSDLLPRGSSIVLGVSGGIDSVALLDALSKLQPDWNWQLVVAHLDHNVRSDSADDAQFVSALAESYGHKFFLGQLDGEENSEAALRQKRYEFFDTIADGVGADYIVTAHHQDDFIETTLFNVIRGADRRGLGALQKKRGQIVRPLLDMSKGQIIAYAHGRGLQWRDDSTNLDPGYTRNALRHEVLSSAPISQPHFRKNYLESLSHLSQIDDRINMALSEIFEHMRESCDVPGALAINRDAFLKLSYEVQEALLVWMLEYLRPGFELSQANLKATLRYLISAPTGSTANLISGLHVERSYGTFVLALQDSISTYSAIQPTQILTVGNSLKHHDRLLHLNAQSVPTEYDSIYILPSDVYVRSFQSGDRVRPVGLDGSKKLSDIFTDQKVSRLARKRWPIVVNRANEIIWVPGLVRDRILTHDAPPGNYQLICEVV